MTNPLTPLSNGRVPLDPLEKAKQMQKQMEADARRAEVEFDHLSESEKEEWNKRSVDPSKTNARHPFN